MVDHHADDVTLQARSGDTSVEVVVSPGAGGRIRQVTVHEGDSSRRLLAPAPPDASASSSGWGSFPMAPWAGRLRHGRFRHGGRDVALLVNHDDGAGAGGAGLPTPIPIPPGPVVGEDRRRHSIHGTTFSRAWRVEHVDQTQLTMTCPLDGALGWDLGGRAVQRFDVRTDSLSCELTVEADDRSFPATVGWHPWFARPDRIDLDTGPRYELDEISMPTGRLVDQGDGPFDDCFLNDAAVSLHYGSGPARTVTITSDTDHLVVYDRPTHAVCIEPQSGPPDAANVRPEVVAPGSPLTRTMNWAW